MRSRKEIFMENTHNISQDQAYKIAGISYLMVFIISIFANSFSLQSKPNDLKVSGFLSFI